LLAGAAAVAVIASGAVFAPAIAQAQSQTQTSAQTSAQTGVASTTQLTSGVGIGASVKLESRSFPGHPYGAFDGNSTLWIEPVNTSVKPDEVTRNGTVRFVDRTQGVCVTNMSILPTKVAFQREKCDLPLLNAFYLVPVSPTPSATSTNPDEHWFYIVSTFDDSCPTLDGNRNYRAEPCVAGNHDQQFRIMDDKANGAGVFPEWRNVLSLAIAAGTSQCADDSSQCQVSPKAGAHAGEWFSSNDPDVAALGTISTRSLGCGEPVGDQPQRVRNGTSSPAEYSVTTAQETTNTVETSDGTSVMVGVAYSTGLKDVWGVKAQASFTYEHKKVVTVSKSESKELSTKWTIEPGEWLMGSWVQQIYTLSGSWKLGMNLPHTTPGTFAWTIPAESSYAAAVVGGEGMYTYGPVTSQDAKNCGATAASQINPGNANKPAPVISGVNCADAFSTPQTAAVGTTVTACPGSWSIPPTKNGYSYQWYLSSGLSGDRKPIPGANDSTYPVRRDDISSDLTKPSYLSVSVQDRADADRLDSPVVQSLATVQLVGSLSDPPPSPTVFADLNQRAVVGSAFVDSVVTTAASGASLAVSAGALPDGISLSPDGLLSGTPTTVGSASFTVADGAGQSRDYTLAVDPDAIFADTSRLAGVVGAPFESTLVHTVSAHADPAVIVGSLPPGLVVDADGVLSGTPTESGTYVFSLGHSGDETARGDFAMTISDSISVFATGLPEAQVGVAYSAPTVTALGSRALIGFSSDDPASSQSAPEGVDGLSIDALTGQLAGTPTRAGSVKVAIVDLSTPGASPLSTTIVVKPASASGGKGASGSTLAATGIEAGAPIGLALLLAFAGVAALVVRRRARAHGGSTE
jgi:hypothetical protein